MIQQSSIIQKQYKAQTLIYYYYMKRISSLIFALFLLVLVHSQDCCGNNLLNIVGAGAVSVNPDTAVFYVSATANGKTSALALSNVNTFIAQAEAVLSSLGLPTADLQTTSINLYPIYNYTNGTTVLIGQQATEVLQVTVGDLSANKNFLGEVAANLSTVSNISISGFTFQNSNKTLAFRAARIAAVADAEAKASEYALLSGKSLGHVFSITDQNTQVYTPFQINTDYYSFRSKILSVPFGKVQVSANVQIKWRLKG